MPFTNARPYKGCSFLTARLGHAFHPTDPKTGHQTKSGSVT